MRRAFHTRMGGVPKAFSQNDSREAREEVDRYIYQAFLPTHDRIVSEIKERDGMIEELEWVKRFPQAKAENLFRSWIVEQHIRRTHKCFVKKEKSVIDSEDLQRVLIQESSIVNKGDLKFDPRGISVPHEEMRVASGPWADCLSRVLYRNLYRQIYYNPGNTPVGTSSWFRIALERVRSGKWQWALAVQGDDSLFIFTKQGKITILCADMSRYDMSIRTAHLIATWQLTDRFMPKCPTREIALSQAHKKIYHDHHGKYEVEGTMASGDFITISFNSLILIQAFLSWDRVDFEDHMSKLGFAVTFKETEEEDLLAVDFLQSRLWLSANGRVFGPKPGRILSRFFWIDKTYAKSYRYLRELKTMCIGLWPIASHVPIINDLLANLIELLLDVEPTADRFQGPEEIRQWFVGSSEDEHPLSTREMASFYGITEFEINLLRQRCRNWNFDGPIDNTPELSRIVARIARVDLE